MNATVYERMYLTAALAHDIRKEAHGIKRITRRAILVTTAIVAWTTAALHSDLCERAGEQAIVSLEGGGCFVCKVTRTAELVKRATVRSPNHTNATVMVTTVFRPSVVVNNRPGHRQEISFRFNRQAIFPAKPTRRTSGWRDERPP